MDLPVWFEIGSLIVLVLILVADLPSSQAAAHPDAQGVEPLGRLLRHARADLRGTDVAVRRHEYAGQFIAGWLTEYSLSIDNLFVFVLIMSQFSVPRRYQQEVLMVGIIIALVLRGLFILAGAAIIEQFSWVFYIFGAFLIWTAWRRRSRAATTTTTSRRSRSSCGCSVGRSTSATTTTARRCARSSTASACSRR
jgi:tellurite resistance protein TerC